MMALSKKEIEDHMAYYIDGKCSDAVRRELDERRLKDPDVDMLIRAYESLLSILVSTPVVSVPNGFSNRVSSAIRKRDQKLAEEKRRYQKDILLLLPIGLFIAAIFSYVYLHIANIAGFTYKFITNLTYGLSANWFVSTILAHLMNIAEKLLTKPLQLTTLYFSYPLYYLAAFGLLICFLIYINESYQS